MRIRQSGITSFVPWPAGETLPLAWPTGNRLLFEAPDRYFARTRANPDYGKPGWTRDCGHRFHRGCDIAPLNVRPTGATTTVQFTDCATGREYPSEEPVLIPTDEVFAVADGEVEEINRDEAASLFGCYVVLRHRWPRCGDSFFTLYAHLSAYRPDLPARVPAGRRVGYLGQTSSSADARNWMAIAPHLHFEVWNAWGESHDPALFLETFLPRAAGSPPRA